MCTLTVHHHAEPVTMHDHPLAKVIAAVRQRVKARGLNFILSDQCLKTARDHYIEHGSIALAITKGQRLADDLSGRSRHHDWRGDGPGAAA